MLRVTTDLYPFFICIFFSIKAKMTASKKEQINFIQSSVCSLVPHELSGNLGCSMQTYFVYSSLATRLF